MSTVSGAAVEWPLSPYDDDNFESISMGTSTVVDSEYAARKIWMSELQRELVKRNQLLPGGSMNVQIQVVNNSTSVTSGARNVEEIVATKDPEKKINRDHTDLGKKINPEDTGRWKNQVFFVLVAILVLTAVSVVVLWMLHEQKHPGNPYLRLIL